MGGSGELMPAGWLYAPAVAEGEWYRLVTSMFLHFGIVHLAFNMYALYLFGPLLEQLYGHIDYLIIYFLCGIGGGVMTILFAPESGGRRRIGRDLRPFRRGVHGLPATAPAAGSAGARRPLAGRRPAARQPGLHLRHPGHQLDGAHWRPAGRRVDRPAAGADQRADHGRAVARARRPPGQEHHASAGAGGSLSC